MEHPSSVRLLDVELITAEAQNKNLEKENMRLHRQLMRLTSTHNTNAMVNAEANILAMRLETEREELFALLKDHKQKYSKLYIAYLEKSKRCNALEEIFKRQKKLTNLVMKSSFGLQITKQDSTNDKSNPSNWDESEEVEHLKSKILTMQKALDESYEIIDDMDFKLESIKLFEMQNQTLREELLKFKATNPNPMQNILDDESLELEISKQNNMLRPACKEDVESSVESESQADDSDIDTLERAALTTSLLSWAEVESNGLTRELARARRQLDGMEY